MKRILPISFLIFLFLSLGALAQKGKSTDWSKTNFADEYKLNLSKYSGGVAKELQKSPVFVCDYKMLQYVQQKSANQKGGGPTVFAEAVLGGVEKEAYQKLTDELYDHLVSELKKAGLKIADGEAVIKSETAQKVADGKKEYAVDYPGGVENEKALGTGEYAIFRPRRPQYFSTKKIPGTFYMKLARKEDVNLIYTTYTFTFAGFDRSRGYSSKRTSVGPYLTVNINMSITTPKGKWTVATFKKAPIVANNSWSQGVEKTSEHDGSYWGLSSKGSFTIHADQEKFLAEIKGMVKGAQEAMVAGLKEKF